MTNRFLRSKQPAMRTRLLCMLLTVCVTWLGMSVYRASDRIEAECQSAGGIFVYRPYARMRCVAPGKATPATEPRATRSAWAPSLSV